MCCYGASDTYVMTAVEVCGRAELLYLRKKDRNGTLGVLVAESRTASMICCMHAIGLLFFSSPMNYKAVVLICGDLWP